MGYMEGSPWASVKAVLPQQCLECKDDMGRSVCLTNISLSCETEDRLMSLLCYGQTRFQGLTRLGISCSPQTRMKFGYNVGVLGPVVSHDLTISQDVVPGL